jgi:hypothetical protein
LEKDEKYFESFIDFSNHDIFSLKISLERINENERKNALKSIIKENL